MSKLRFHVVDSITGRIVGRLHPIEWSWSDPLTGQAEGSLTVAIPTEMDRLTDLVAWTQPHTRSVCVQDDLGRWWFGGPILSAPERTDKDQVVISLSDWRAWFYAASIRPIGNTRVEYLHLAASSNQVEQCQAITDLATLGLATIGAPRLVVDAPPNSGVMRDVTARMFKFTGGAMDNVAQRYNAPDWYTYISSDPADARNVIAHLAVGWPERALRSSPMSLRREIPFRTVKGSGGNLLSHTWPKTSPPPSRVLGVGSEPPPDEMWAVAESPDLLTGERLAWDEVWALPEGTTSADTAFAHSLARLMALGQDVGTVAVTIKVDATDLGSWGPGDRTRLIIKDGWIDIDLPSARIISRTLTGRGENVVSVAAQIDLAAEEVEFVEPEPEEA